MRNGGGEFDPVFKQCPMKAWRWNGGKAP